MTSLFFSYCHADELLRDQLAKHLNILAKEGIIDAWHDRCIQAGQEIATEIDKHIKEADIILLLISPDFLSSRYCYEIEMANAMALHEAGKAIVIPVILRPCDWHNMPFGKLLAVPTDGKPIMNWCDRDSALLDVTQAVRKAIQNKPVHGAQKSNGDLDTALPRETMNAGIEKHSNATSIPKKNITPFVDNQKLLAGEQLPRFTAASPNAFFEDRFKQAFPGVRSPTWFSKENNSIDRLARLLQLPLKFSNAAPIWWWRDGNNSINSFKILENQVVLMNFEELTIRRIAAIPGTTYKQNFVYIETEPMLPTGIYKIDEKTLLNYEEQFGYVSEEYGLYDGHHVFSRSEYDDGGTYINGTYVDTTRNSIIRKRYITPYNFIIAAQDSPINNKNYDSRILKTMNFILHEKNPEKTLKDFFAELSNLPIL